MSLQWNTKSMHPFQVMCKCNWLTRTRPAKKVEKDGGPFVKAPATTSYLIIFLNLFPWVGAML